MGFVLRGDVFFVRVVTLGFGLTLATFFVGVVVFVVGEDGFVARDDGF